MKVIDLDHRYAAWADIMIGCSLHVSTQLKRMDGFTHDTPVASSLDIDVSRDSPAMTSVLDEILDTASCEKSIICTV